MANRGVVKLCAGRTGCRVQWGPDQNQPFLETRKVSVNLVLEKSTTRLTPSMHDENSIMGIRYRARLYDDTQKMRYEWMFLYVRFLIRRVRLHAIF